MADRRGQSPRPTSSRKRQGEGAEAALASRRTANLHLAISGRDALGCCETINIINKYVWYTGEPAQPSRAASRSRQ